MVQMGIKIKHILFLVSFLPFIQLKAQRNYFPYFNQYRFDGMVMNPAFAGSRDLMSVSLFYKQRLDNFNGGEQKYQTFSAHTPLKNYKIGLGFLFLHESLGITHNYDYFFNYAYRFNMLGGKLALGLKGGVTYNTENYNEFENSVRNSIDPVTSFLPTKEKMLLPNFGVGFFYYNQDFFFGGSIPLLLSTEENEDGSKPSITHDFKSYNYFINTGYKFGEREGVKFIPSLLVLYKQNSKIFYIGNLNVDLLNDRFSLGSGYSSSKTLQFSAQFKINEQLRIGYTYDDTFFGEYKVFGATHELMLRYEFKYIIKASSPLDF